MLVFKWLVRRAGTLITIIAALALLVWIAGRFVSDRYEWSQWIAWAPSPAAIAVAIMGFIGSLHPGGTRRRQRVRAASWGGVVALSLLYFSFIEHHLITLRSCDEERSGLRIVHWNPSMVEDANAHQLAKYLAELDADITLLTNAPRVPRQKPVGAWLGPDALPLALHPFSIMSKLPVLEARRVVAAKQLHAVLVRIDATEALGRELTILAVDLPSDPERSRMETARTMRTWLDEANLPPIDIMMGDFNMTRNSASINHLAPDHRDAFDAAGIGYGASYPRKTPWLHIDHMLIANDINPLSYCIIDPGAGAHRLQMMTIR